KAASDRAIEGERKVMVSHSLSVEGDAAVVAAYDKVAISNVEVRVLDNDIGTALVLETGGSTRVLEGGPVAATSASSAIDDHVTVRLPFAPTANVTVNLSFDASQIQVYEGSTAVTSLTFTSSNWNTARDLTIKAVNDSVRENTRVARITYSFTS